MALANHTHVKTFETDLLQFNKALAVHGSPFKILMDNLKVMLQVFFSYPLGKPPCKKSAVFLNIVKKAFDPPPPFV